MRTLLLLFGILLLSRALAAQGEVVVVHATGKVSYFPPQQSKAEDVYPGLRLELDGSVRCQSGGSVKLLFNGETFSFSDGKMHPLRELEQLAKKSSGMGFFNRFWSFVSGSMKQTKDEKTLEENHRRYMESVYAGVKGFALRQYAIQTNLMYSGNLSDQPVTFTWKGMAPEQTLRFRISRKDDEQVLLSAQVRDSAFSIDLSQLYLEPGTIYHWQVLPVDETATAPRSARTDFTYDPEAAAKALASLLPYPDYQHAPPAHQALMEAYVLEQAGFLYDADRKYAVAARANPRDVLVRETHAAFLARVDRLEEAKALIGHRED